MITYRVRLIAVQLIVLLLASTAEAATYWVSPSGSNGNPCTNSATPLSTAAKLTVVAGVNCITAAGDTLTIRAGTYNEGVGVVTPTVNGISGSPITVKAHTAETVTFVRNPIVLTDRAWWTFDRLLYDGTGTAQFSEVIHIGGSANNLKFTGVEIFNGGGSGIVSQGSASDILIQDCKIHDLGTNRFEHGIYSGASRTTVERCEIYNTTGSSLKFGEFAPTRTDGGIARYNVLRNFSTDTTPNVTGGNAVTLSSGADNTKVHNNLMYNCSAAANNDAAAVFLFADVQNNSIYNNTIYNTSSNCVLIDIADTTPTGTVIKNNALIANGTTRFLTGDTVTFEGNFCDSVDTGCEDVGSIGFVDAANNDFRLTSSSPAIDSGTTSITGSITLICNGGAGCSAGAYDPPRVNSCSATGNTLSVIYTVNQFPPMANLDAPGGKGITVDGSSRTLSLPVIVGSNQVNYTFSGAAVSSTTTHTDGGTGTLSDSILVGNLAANVQRVRSVGTTTCTVAGGATTFTQTYFRFHGLRGTEAAPIVKAAVNVNWTIQANGCVRCRIKVACTVGNCLAFGPQIRYSRNGGSYTAIPETYGADNIKLYGTSDSDAAIPAHLTPTTELLTSDQATNVAGAIIRTAATVPTLDLSQDSETENEWIICIDSDEVIDTTFDFRVYKNDNTVLTTYSQTPRLTVKPAEFQGMQMSQVDIETDQPIRIVRRRVTLGYVEVRVNKGTTVSINGVPQ